MSLSLNELALAVKNGEDRALAAIEDLNDPCVVVAPGKTLFDLAIECDNRLVIDRLSQNKQALAFAAPIEDDFQAGINFHVSEDGVEYPIDTIEGYLTKTFGPQLNFARTPLLSACRLGNRYAMEVLLKTGAKPADKDRLKLTAPELCFYARGVDGVREFLQAFEASGQKPFAANANLVRELLAYPDLLEQLKVCAKLGAPVQKLLFCYDCARLDVDAVRRTLAGKFDINKAITRFLNPVQEACTSHLFWNDRLPGHGYYAYHLTKYIGPAGSHSIHVDNDLIAPDGSNLDKLMREAEQKRRALEEEGKRLTLSNEDAADQLQKRCAIIDALMDAGLDVEKAEDKLDEDFFDELKGMGLRELVTHMKQFGFDGARPVQKAAPSSIQTFWELPVESLLEAEVVDEGPQWYLELVHSNVYGPVDGVTVEVRFGDEDGNTGQWQALDCWAQTLDRDGQIIPRAKVPNPIVEEMPWQARYRTEPCSRPLPASISVRLSGPEHLANVALGDWVLEDEVAQD
ncbi:hypothetical protein [Microbulbifer sp.]|uniref:hypothetical protein n=1 Tax=Microbulbifer sp. TaxID=1908541 RepID=UPI003F3C6ECE